jgi:hypothetical protein
MKSGFPEMVFPGNEQVVDPALMAASGSNRHKLQKSLYKSLGYVRRQLEIPSSLIISARAGG